MSRLIECNFDGIVGPTHHFGGLGVGNLASLAHAGVESHPRAAALQGLDKIEQVVKLADARKMRAAVLPPQPRPDLEWLHSLGFFGSTAETLQQASSDAPQLLAAAWSASAMWTANAATVTPALDSQDAKCHLTVSNLTSSTHRSLESATTQRVLSQVFSEPELFCVHPPLRGGWAFRDEGAANHMRLCGQDGSGGLHLFVHGIEQDQQRFPSRQGVEACAAIVRLHRLAPSHVMFIAQHPRAIEAGAFHNDVVATSHADLLLHHEFAFADSQATLERLQRAFTHLHGKPPRIVTVQDADLPLSEAISCYLFNSQVLPYREGGLALLCPQQCQESLLAQQLIGSWLSEGLFREVCYVELRESMSNGGGPACLRLRVPLTAEQYSRIHPGVLWTEQLSDQLRRLIETSYPTRLTAADLTDPTFAEEAWETIRNVHDLLQLK